MFIFWGTKAVVRKRGYVADFCPICRSVQTFQLSRIGMASHVYGASFGEGKLVGHLITCIGCGTELRTDTSIYKDVQKKIPGAGSADLSASTFPNIRQHYSERLSLEDQVARKPTGIDAKTRASLIREPFQLLAPMVEKRFSSTHIDRYVGATLLLTIGGVALVGHLFGTAYKEEAILGILAIGFVATCVQAFKSGGRYLRKEIYPRIARSLRPLKPTQSELEAALTELKQRGFKLSKKARPKEILQALTAVG
jgi:hypothetical protein